MPVTIPRRVAAVLLTAVLAAGAAVAAPEPVAVAADRCAVSVRLPAKIVIDREEQVIAVPPRDPCGLLWEGKFHLYGPDYTWSFEYDYLLDKRVTRWAVHDSQDVGVHTIRDSWATDREGNFLPLAGASTTIKRVAWAGLSAERSGSRVTVRATAKGWNRDEERLTYWSHPSATLQYRSGSSWKTLRKVALTSGKARFSFTQSTKRTYRLVLAETGNNWSDSSRQVTI